jgi:hypothetical protein
MTFTAETLFSIANMVAMMGWVLLIVLPQQKVTLMVVRNGVLSMALAVAYAMLIILYLFNAEGGFDSLHNVGELFSNPYVLLAGWIHYLAFDLLIGCWQVRDAQRHGLSHRWVIPSLLCTFLAGPAGYLLYRITLEIKRDRKVTA